jgi:hypothetical protein
MGKLQTLAQFALGFMLRCHVESFGFAQDRLHETSLAYFRSEGVQD